MVKHQHDRKIVHYLLQPFIQLKIGLVQSVLSLAFVCGLGWYSWFKLHQITEVIATLTQADAEVSEMIANYLSSVAVVAAIAAVVFILVTLTVTVLMTHKMIGPTIAFRRLIKDLLQEKFGAKISLRKGDAFQEVADDLNNLSQYLTKYSGRKG